MNREYAEAYVKWGDTEVINLDYLSVDAIIFGGLSFLSLGLSAMTHRFVFSSVLFMLFLTHCILTAALKQRCRELTYFQKFLNIGGSGLFTRLMFLLMSLSILEVTGMYGAWYYLLLSGVWLFLNILDFWFTWWNIQRGRFYAIQERVKEREKQRERQEKKSHVGALVTMCSIGGVAGILGQRFAKVFFADVSQSFAVNFAVWIFLALGIGLGMGSNNLWKAYYVKKYDIQGQKILAYIPRSGRKQTVIHSVLRTFRTLGLALVILISFSIGLTLIMFFFLKWLPAWLGRM